MPDTREILAALSPEDRQLWDHARNTMRRTYISVHGATTGSEQWERADDMFLDLIDIKLATLFDRAGKLTATKNIIEDSSTIEKDINDTVIKMNGKADDKLPVIWPNGQN